MEKPMILLIAPSLASFVVKDLDLLTKIGSVDKLIVKPSKGLGMIQNLLLQFLVLIRKVHKYDVVYIWFADYHSFLPILFGRLFRKKTYVVLGGSDVNCIPDLKYGFCSNRIRKFCTAFTIRHANFLLPVDDSLKSRLESTYSGKTGRIVVVPTGFDPQKWYCDTPKEQLVLTVGIFSNLQRIKIKGIDFFIEVARLTPDIRFIVVRAAGGASSLLDLPDNVTIITERLDDEELRLIYSRAKIYCQFSLTEGLPSSVCEAMLCECIPVGTDVGGMRNAISGFGYVLESRDPVATSKLLREISDSSKGLEMSGREHMKFKFNLENRLSALKELLR